MADALKPQFIQKYKPYKLDDFYFEDSFKSMIQLLIEMNDLNVMFTGNSNSGKTSLLYAIVREYYHLTKDETLPENNILFINNLKEQGIHFFRNEMKTFCQSQSLIRGKKKMIIIDDMDMINQQNQQVFCNYIDKYKENVCFVFVCLNVQKIIENIQSRIVLLKIEPPTLNQLSNFMDKIILQETMNIEDDVKQYILSISNYSIRSLINNLEKVNIYTMDDKLNPNARISLDICKKLCSNISLNWFEDYISFLRNQNLNDAIKILYEINDYGYSVIDILDYFFSFVKMTDLLDEEEKYNIIHILCKYITIFHNVHEDVIELSLLTNDIYRRINALRITNGMC
jgi:DNA polymerase III delta prime subunit